VHNLSGHTGTKGFVARVCPTFRYLINRNHAMSLRCVLTLRPRIIPIRVIQEIPLTSALWLVTCPKQNRRCLRHRAGNDPKPGQALHVQNSRTKPRARRCVSHRTVQSTIVESLSPSSRSDATPRPKPCGWGLFEAHAWDSGLHPSTFL
jgi:hypothetical protein